MTGKIRACRIHHLVHPHPIPKVAQQHGRIRGSDNGRAFLSALDLAVLKGMRLFEDYSDAG